MGDYSVIRDGGDGVACGQGSSMFSAEHKGMGFSFVVVFGSSFSFSEVLVLDKDTGRQVWRAQLFRHSPLKNSSSLADELEEALDAEIVLCLYLHFLAISLCAEDVVCNGDKTRRAVVWVWETREDVSMKLFLSCKVHIESLQAAGSGRCHLAHRRTSCRAMWVTRQLDVGKSYSTMDADENMRKGVQFPNQSNSSYTFTCEGG
ncbi:hypothetical protein EDB19DRAFT_1746185 [Suillus lakei]|nr:hypothetical protein EDB19DRAFT_1746185 [Suillus lakei]